MSQSKHSEPAGRAPSSGHGASSALDAMVRKRIPPPGTPPLPDRARERSVQASAPKQRS